MWKAEGAFRCSLLSHHESRAHFTPFPPSCDIDVHLPSCSSGPYKFQSLPFLTPHFTQGCTGWRLHWAEISFFTPPNSSPEFRMRNMALALFLSNVVIFPFVPLIYIYIDISCPDKCKWSFSKINNVIFAKPYSTPWQLIIFQLNLLLIGSCSALIFCYLFTEDQNA